MFYNYYFEGGQNNSYFFETNKGVVYRITFKPTPYLFGKEKTKLSESIFEFSVLIEFNPNEKLPANDLKIGLTTAAIFSDFYLKKGDAITIYICESSDNKEAIRKRKFDIWFSKYNDIRFFKIDKILIDNKKKRFPISLIMTDSNPYRNEIMDLFSKLVTENNENK